MSDPSGNGTGRAALQDAIAALQKTRARLEALERSRSEPIAIVGMGCRFPGGVDSPDALWRLLKEGRDAITEVPPDRWDVAAYYDPDPDAPGKMATRWGGFLERVDAFDAPFFGISAREAARMDPQQRLVLEVGWEALEHAAIAPDTLAGTETGVFIGMSGSDYAHLLHELAPDDLDGHVSTGNALCVTAGRLSYLLGLQGPSMVIDTACSSSLVAVHLACQSLRSGECRVALAGGVNQILVPEPTIIVSRAHMMAADGRCKSFDAAADGYVRSEGCGVVVLKRLSEATRDGDRVLALLRATAVNQDGRSGGLTAPNAVAQEALLRKALGFAGLRPGDLSYVEAHGSGTPLGDPIEIGALAAALCDGRAPSDPLVVGTIKTNIGHTEAAAGIAGLLKTVLALQHGEIPPDLHFHRPNPHVPWSELPIAVATGGPRPWPRRDRLRVAGVSSFGFSGTNAHAIVQEPPVQDPARPRAERPLHLLCVSAKGEGALAAAAARVQAHCSERAADTLADVAFTANAGRSHFAHRIAVVGASCGDAAERLAAHGRGAEGQDVITGHAQPGAVPRIAFLYTGQGAQHVGMGRQLFETQPTFRRAIEECQDLLRPHLGRSLIEVLYPGDGDAGLIDRTAYTQPAMFALQYALTRLWRSFGVEPAAVLGHSVGELAAAWAAGVLELPDAIRLVAERGRLMQALPAGGAMASVSLEQAEVASVIADRPDLAIAALNGPQSTVVSGARASLAPVIESLRARGVGVDELVVSHAFHSPLMEPMLEPLERFAASIRSRPPRLHLVSNVTGCALDASAVLDAAYWREHARNPVRFGAGMETLASLGCTAFVEIGPTPVLVGLGQRCLPGREDALWLPSLRRRRDDWSQLLESVARLYVRGATLDWAGFDRDYRRRKVDLPTYPFQRQRHWLDARRAGGPRRAPASPAAASSLARSAPASAFHELQWKRADASVGPSPRQPQRWVVLGDGALAEDLEREVRARGDTCLSIRDGGDAAARSGQGEGAPIEALRRVLADPRPPTRIVNVWDAFALEPGLSAGSSRDQVERICGPALLRAQALLGARMKVPPRVWHVTAGAHRVGEDSHAPSPHQALVWGLGRVVALEDPESWGGLIDVAPTREPGDAARVVDEIEREAREDQVVLRGGRRWVARLVQQAAATAPGPLHLRADATYLVTGGWGALGLEVARWLAEHGARHVAVVGRTEPGADARVALDRLAASGVRVAILRADVSDRDALAQALAQIERTLPPVRGVVHAAGVLDDGLVAQQDWARFERVLAPKACGAWNLHALTRDRPLDLFVLFSSMASLLGSPGQASYAAANAFLDALAHHRRATGLPGLSVNWGPWARVGMAASVGARHRQRWAERGLELLAPEAALEALGEAISRGLVQTAVMRVSWPTLMGAWPAGPVPALLADLGGSEVATASPSEPEVLARFLGAPAGERRAIVERYLRDQLRRVLGTEADIGGGSNLLDLGVDSLLMMEVVNACKRDLGLRLYPREIYERPSVDALSAYLTGEIATARGLESAAAAAITSPAAALASTQVPPPAPAAPRRSVGDPSARNARAVFLLSSPRAGSTLLRVMLAGHPRLFCPPELHLLPFETMADRERALGRSFLGEGLQRAAMELRGMSADESRALVQRWVGESAGVKDVYAWLQDAAGARLLVDKSPSYGRSVETLRRAEELFDAPLYVHLARHPHSVIESFVRNRMSKLIGGDDQDPHARAEQVWAGMNRNILDFLDGVPAERQIRVRFEDLVKDAERVGPRITQLLGIPWDARVLTPYQGSRMTDGVRSGSLGIGDPNFLDHEAIDPALADVWKTIELPRPLGPAARDVAKTLGYELPAAKGRPVARAAPAPVAASQGGGAECRVEVRGLRLCLCSWGPEDGPVALCLHGILDHGSAWEGVARELAARGYRVLAPDLRGHGCSDHAGGSGGYRLLEYVADVDALLGKGSARVRAAAEPVMLVGHSMGAAVASLFSALRPERVAGLVLVESLLPDQGGSEDLLGRLRTQLEYLGAAPAHAILEDVAAAAARLRATMPALGPERALRFAERLTEPRAVGVRWRWDPRLITRADLSADSLGLGRDAYLGVLRTVRAPTVLVHTPESRDVLGVLEGVLPVWKTAIVPGTHNLHVEAVERIAELTAELGDNARRSARRSARMEA